MSDMKQAAMDRAGELPVERRVGECRVAASAFTEQQITAAARALSDHSASYCQVNAEDNWNIYSTDYIYDAKLALEAAAAVAPAVPVAAELSATIDQQESRWAIDGAITYGRMGVNPPPTDDHWLNQYWQIGRQLAKLGETSAWDNVTPADDAPAPALPVVPTDWILVPMKPTPEMIAAGVPLRLRVDNGLEQLYTAMIAAALVLSVGLPSQHPDDIAVDRFAAAMKAKMAVSRAKGRGGWESAEECPADRLRLMMRDHLAKGDPVDVGNFVMMLFNRGESTTSPIAEAPSESIDCKSFSHKLICWHLAEPGDDAKEAYDEIVAHIHSWHQRATQAAKPLTDAHIKELAEPFGVFEFGDAQGDKRLAFARAIESHLKGE